MWGRKFYVPIISKHEIYFKIVENLQFVLI